MKPQLLLEITSSSLLEFQRAAQVISKLLPTHSVVALSGVMGAGKTELVKTLCAEKGIKSVSSPTFALHQRYQSASQCIEHWDLYRIDSEDELEATGFWDLFAQEPLWILIEWPDKMNLEQIPSNWNLFWVEIEVLAPQSRRIRLRKRS